MQAQLPNQAHMEFDDKKNQGEDEVSIDSEEIGMLHAVSDKPGAEFDLIIEDMAGNEQFVKRGCKNPTTRWGERIDLPVIDSRYKVKLENVNGAKTIDVFCE